MNPINTSNAGCDKSSSVYRGVTRQLSTGRYEAHFSDGRFPKDGHTRKSKQVFLGRFDEEDKAARAYDMAVLKYWGPSVLTNFPIENYEKELEEMKNMSKQGYIEFIRRSSAGFSPRKSAYRGVTRANKDGQWKARFGRFDGKRDLYLGTFIDQVKAAEAYDFAAIKLRGENAFTNFDKSRYDVEAIMNTELNMGKKTKWNKPEVEDKETNGGNDCHPYNLFDNNISSCKEYIAPINVFDNISDAADHGLGIGCSALPSGTSLPPPFTNQDDASKARKTRRSRVGARNREDGFQCILLGFKPTPLNVESIENVSSCTDCIASTDIYDHLASNTMEINHGLETEDFPLLSQPSLSTQFNNVQEGLFVSRVPTFQNKLSLGASTFFFPGKSSGVIKAGHENVIPCTNLQTPSILVSENGLKAGATRQPPVMFNISSESPVMFNIWSDKKML